MIRELDLLYQVGKARLLKKPLVATFMVTDRCNLSCKHCPKDFMRACEAEADTPTILSTLDYLDELGVRGVLFWGGEPLMREDIPQILDYATNKFYTAIATNGVFPFSGLNVDVVIMSIDGLRETHDFIRGRGVFDTAMGNMVGVDNVNIVFTINPYNYGEVYEFTRYCYEKLNVRVGFNFVHGFWGVARLTPEQRKQAITQLLHAKKDFTWTILNSKHILKNLSKRVVCKRWSMVSVDPKCNVEVGKCMPINICNNCSNYLCFREWNAFLDFNLDSVKLSLEMILNHKKGGRVC